jgi:hypothetical protein
MSHGRSAERERLYACAEKIVFELLRRLDVTGGVPSRWYPARLDFRTKNCQNPAAGR